MAIGAIISLALFVVILGSVGVRLTLLWTRTREVPEMALGFGLVLLALSMPLTAVGRIPATAMELVGRLCFGAGLWVAATGLGLLFFFNFWVFRRESSWALALVITLAGFLGSSVAYMTGVNFTGSSVGEIKGVMRPGTLTLIATVAAAFAWAAIESLRYWVACRRRRRLGLDDPVVSNRFFLWGVSSATSCALMAIIIVCVVKDMTIMREALPLAALSSSGCLMSAAWTLTFLAPERYQRFIRDRSRSAGTTAS